MADSKQVHDNDEHLSSSNHITESEAVFTTVNDSVEPINESISQVETTINNDTNNIDKDDVKDSKLYSYINQDYTTEIYKIEIRNLPRNINHGAFLSFLRKRNLKFRKAKLIQAKFKKESHSHAYVTLKSEEDRTKAMETLNGLKFKGCILSVYESNPLPDPLLMKRKFEEQSDKQSVNEQQHNNKRQRTDAQPQKQRQLTKAQLDDNFDELPEEKRVELINKQVASMWNVPYEEQISKKCALLYKMRDTWREEFKKSFFDLPKDSTIRADMNQTLQWLDQLQLESDFIRSPVINGYRNKCEFNVGSDGTLGFRLGLYREGTIKVVSPPANCPIISSQMRQVLDHFQCFLREKTTLSGFNPINHEGYWRQILVRTTRSGQCLVSIALHRQQLTDEQIESEVIKPLCSHFENQAAGVCSLYVQVIADRSSQVAKTEPRLIAGEAYVYEKLMNDSLQFRISALSFFQINTAAAELLYAKVVELAACTPQTTVLDICCGTGTIGLCFARSVRKVIGFELNEDAIKDARFNAKLNEIENIEFHCGRAEVLIGQTLVKLLNNHEETDVVAILDPPRSGLPANLIKAVRNNVKIKRLVYISCEAMAARRNFIDLCRPKSNAYHGVPFTPRKAIAVDLFPHSERCELVVLFERLQNV